MFKKSDLSRRTLARPLTCASIAIALLLAGTSAAVAEGSSGWRNFWGINPGFDTSNYYDNDFDSAATKFGLDDCYQDNGNSHGGLQWTLVRHRTALPGVNVATNTLACGSASATTSYGAQDRAWYHFEFQGAATGTDYYYSGLAQWWW